MTRHFRVTYIITLCGVLLLCPRKSSAYLDKKNQFFSHPSMKRASIMHWISIAKTKFTQADHFAEALMLHHPSASQTRHWILNERKKKKQKKISDTVECFDGYNEYTQQTDLMKIESKGSARLDIRKILCSCARHR